MAGRNTNLVSRRSPLRSASPALCSTRSPVGVVACPAVANPLAFLARDGPWKPASACWWQPSQVVPGVGGLGHLEVCGIKIVGKAENDNGVPALAAQTSPIISNYPWMGVAAAPVAMRRIATRVSGATDCCRGSQHQHRNSLLGRRDSFKTKVASRRKRKLGGERSLLAQATGPCEDESTNCFVRKLGISMHSSSALSSRGLGHRPLKAETRVRIPLALPTLSGFTLRPRVP
jgi:hypothetical protein